MHTLMLGHAELERHTDEEARLPPDSLLESEFPGCGCKAYHRAKQGRYGLMDCAAKETSHRQYVCSARLLIATRGRKLFGAISATFGLGNELVPRKPSLVNLLTDRGHGCQQEN